MTTPLTPNSARRITLTEEERGWVNNIRAAVEQSNEDFGKISDFEYAHHAIVAKDKVDKALTRLRRIKQFKERYEITNDITVYEAMKILRQFAEIQPNFLCSFGKHAPDGNLVLVYRMGAFIPSKFKTKEEQNFMFQALYYLFHAMQSDLDTIRNGTIWVGDCTDIGRDNLSIPLVHGGTGLYRDAYPMRVKFMPLINTPTIINVLYGMIKPFLSERVKEVMQLNVSAESIQGAFEKSILPSYLGGTQKTDMDALERLEASLQKRFETNESFRLDP